MLDGVHRRDFLHAAGTGLATAHLIAVAESPPPAELHASDIAHIRDVARVLAGWDHTYGGAVARAAVTAHLSWAFALLHTRVPAGLREDAFSAVAQLANVSGFLAFDAYLHDEAHQRFTWALRTAEEVGDWHLRAKVLSNRARQAIWRNRPDDGLTDAELGLVRADRLSPPEQAMLHTARARAYAKLGERDLTLAAVDAADRAFAAPRTGREPDWMGYYDTAQHHGDTGHALWDLAVSGLYPPGEALARLERAVEGHGDAYARSRAISGIKLASLQMRSEPELAVKTAMRALDDAGRVRSRRAEDDLRELRAITMRRPGPVTDDLTGRITTLVGNS
ncbi:hypothetical protein GCM10027294_22390 [Marinactinospora endophytica]